jgi:hypothetical protein
MVNMYIDPNSGGMLFGILAALFTALSGVILAFSGRIRAYFAKQRRKARENEQAEEKTQE